MGKLVTPLAQPATSPQSTGWLFCGILALTVNMSATNENHNFVLLCVHIYMYLYEVETI